MVRPFQYVGAGYSPAGEKLAHPLPGGGTRAVRGGGVNHHSRPHPVREHHCHFVPARGGHYSATGANAAHTFSACARASASASALR